MIQSPQNVRITRGIPIAPIRLDDYADAEAHAYALAAKLNEIIERINAMNEVSR